MIRVVTLNIWNRQGPWEERLPLIIDGLRALAPDVVGLQEVLRFGDEDQARQIAAALGMEHVAYAPAWEIGGGLVAGNALIARRPIEGARIEALPVEPGGQGRSLLFGRVADAPILVTHLTWQLHHADVRAAQVRRIDDLAREWAPHDGFPPILLGDFNAEPESDEIRFLRGLTALGGRGTYWADCFGVRGDGPGYTYARANPYAFATREPSRRIDYVFVRGPDRRLRGEPLAARVVLDRGVGGVFPSDHFGVYAEISE